MVFMKVSDLSDMLLSFATDDAMLISGILAITGILVNLPARTPSSTVYV